MKDDLIRTAHRCHEAAETGTLTFPQIVAELADAGFESYEIDFRQAIATYFLPSGDSVTVGGRRQDEAVAPEFDPAAIRAAIGEAQRLAPGYSYPGFRRKVMAAGCAGYIVSFPGRRALYIGRTAETHVEHFPDRAAASPP